MCAVALGTLATLGTPANAAAGTAPSASSGPAARASSGPAARASSDGAARADTPWKLRTPLSETASREFWDVAATGVKDAWSAGRTTDGPDGPAPLIRHWNGSTWADVPAAATDVKPAQLEKVAAAAPDDAWAAGSLADNTSAPIVLQHWDGKKWTKVGHAAPAEGSLSFVGDLAAFGTKSAWLTSFDWDPNGGTQVSRLERWTGSGWETVSLPAAPAAARYSPGTSPAPARTTYGSPRAP